MIDTIRASNVNGGVVNKSETYRLLNMVHVMAGRCAVAKVDGWELKSTCTMEDYVMTTWTNNIIDIVAESCPNDGEHIYTLKACKEA